MKKQVRINTSHLSDTVILNNLKRWYNEAMNSEITAGLGWYSEAQTVCEEVSNLYNLPPYTVATVVSSLSPNNKLNRNKIDAINVIKAFQKGLGHEDVKVCTFHPNKIKAFKALQDGSIIDATAPKTHAFAMNVGLLSAEHITIDKWHLRACECRPSSKPVTEKYGETCTDAQYRRVEMLTARLAKEYGIKGYQLQAIIWITIKRVWNR